MNIQNLSLKYFRGIKKMEIYLNKQLNVICGINGVGKSSILDAISIQLSWIVARIRSERGSGRPISEYDIKNNANFSMSEMLIEEHNKQYKGKLVKTKKGYSVDEKSSVLELSNYAKEIRSYITDKEEQVSVPVFIYYSTNRIVDDIPLRIRSKHDFNLLETYDNSLETGVNFRSFFEWYRNREDLENEKFRDLNQDNLFNQEKRAYEGDKQLESVRIAIERISGFKDISVKRSPLRMEVNKNGEKLRVEKLSDGEKCLFAMAGDMARRLAIANPTLVNPLEGEGVVLIDEIDLHLHPKWQKKIIPNLLQTFPNVQFIVSTHSPQVLSEVDHRSIILLYQEENNIKYSPVHQSKGLSSNEILEEIMDTQPLNKQVKDQLDNIFKLIDDEKIAEAKKEISDFKNQYGTVPEIVRGETLLSFFDEES
ncbi:AAA family ATPase [Sediminispirochaeta bajacaliforniensis]|uniref:AAA family ATPase n=1 Tax=Sediminispirochaeta bajacaliforniensis TaxID=148 RepID=UPI00036675FF|nr:AAA family ATPase [Sediminispirochaeta bajacaliforniensis]